MLQYVAKASEVAHGVITHQIVDPAEPPPRKVPSLLILNPGQIFPLRRPLITRTCVGGLTANLFGANGAEGGGTGRETQGTLPILCKCSRLNGPRMH